MTRKELESVHPDYAAFINEWHFFIRSYFGGKMYKDGNYLIQHPFESAMNYNRRRDISYYYNYCAPIVDIFVSHLFRQKAKRDYGSLVKDPLFNAFLADADHEGASFRQFMREAARLASIYGRVSIIVDRPKLYTSTVAEAESFGIRPYLSLVTPENLVDWTLKRDLTGRPVLEEIKIREADGIYKIWNLEGWEAWQLDIDTNEAKLIDSGEHNLGAIPIVTLYNKRSGRQMLGISDIQDIADINKNIYYLCSDAKEIIENTAFPMLALPYEKGARDEERQVGPRNILQFDPSEANSKPYWLEAPHSSLTEIREWVKQDITEIHRIAKMGGVKATEDFAQARSGVAIELEYQQLHAVLSEKGDNLEEAETRIMEFWTAWQGKEFDGRIDYPDDFSVRDLDRDLERSIKAVGIDITSAAFKRELQKKVVTSALPKIDDETRAMIDSEIDSGIKGVK